MRNSFIFYKSFYEAIKELPDENRLEIYEAIFKKEFHGEDIELNGISKSIYTLIIPQLEANNKKYENGTKGGRPKKNQNKTKKEPNNNQNETKQEPNVNVNVNDNENDNVNDNDNENDIYSCLEENFGRTLSPIEYESVKEWEDNEITRYAIKQAILNNGRSIKYIQAILNSWKAKNYKTVSEIQKYDTKKGKEIEPEWYNKTIEPTKASEEEQYEMEDLLKKYR